MATTPIWAKQPFKVLYTIGFMVKVLAMLPLLVLRYGPKSLRPLPEQNLRICLVNALCRQLFTYQTSTRSNGVAGVESDHQKAKERFALAQSAEADLYCGVLESDGSRRPAAVGGLWFPSPLEPRTTPVAGSEKVVLHFPGGAFVLAFGTEATGQDVSRVMTQHLHASRTLLAQYRVSTGSDETRFPAAIQDVVTFYHYVLSLGVAPENILLSGDSAAGNLVLGLLRYIEHLKSPRLPPPSGAMLWSPWVHVTAQAGRDYTASRNAENDLLVGEVLQWGVDAYLPRDSNNDADSDSRLPYISPLHHPFKTQVPLFIHAGGSEGFRDAVASFALEMEGIEGNRVRYSQTDQASHNILISHKGLGLDQEMAAVADEANGFFSTSMN